MLDRRRFLLGGLAAAAGAGLAGCRSPAHPPLPAAEAVPPDPDAPWLGLTRSVFAEYDYAARIEGRVPPGLRGTYYRNGPGLFERDGVRRRCLLDGDGMVQAFRITGEGVRYANRYVRTAKFEEEEAALAYRYATWATQAPGGRFANLFARRMASQAGVSVVERGGRLYAFDESFPAHELDPDTLETRGAATLGQPEGRAFFAAHPKSDARNGEWLLFGLEYGRHVTAHLHCFDPAGGLRWYRPLPLPRYTYVHDWFVSERHLVLNLHPVEIDLFDFLLGRTSLVGAMDWRPGQGNLLLIVPRGPTGEVVALERPAAFMWHALNAFERGGEIVADYVGYEEPDHFLGDDPVLFSVMQGRLGSPRAGSLRRMRIDPGHGRVREEVLTEGVACEFPVVDPRRACHPHRFGYLAWGAEGEVFTTQVARVDALTGEYSRYDFGPGRYCQEPMFAPNPYERVDLASGREPGWLLALVYDGNLGRSHLAVLDAERLADGPVAWAHLTHPTPYGFHGCWSPA